MGLVGGIVGGIIGGIFAGPWGAAIGAGIGSMTGNNSSSATSGTKNYSSCDNASSAYGSFFACLGKIAKADGRVSEDEAAFVSETMKTLCPDRSKRASLTAAFNRGRDFAGSFSTLVEPVAMAFPDQASRRAILEVFCTLAMVDHEIDASEREMLNIAESILDLNGFVAAFFSDRDGDRRSSRTAPPPEHPVGLAEYYRILGCAENVSNEDLKKAWRGKNKEFHPDLIQGKGLSATFVEFAKQEIQKVNEAYEKICASRGISAK